MKLTEKSLKRGLVLSVVIGAVSIFLVVALTKTNLDWTGLMRIRLTYLLLAVAFEVASWYAKTLKMQVLAGAMGGKISTGRMMNIFLSSCFISQVTPATSGGIPFQMYMIYRQGVKFGHAVALSVVDSFLTILFYVLMVPLLLFIWRSWIGISTGAIVLVLALTILVCGFLLYLIFKPEVFGSLTIKIGRSRLFRALDRKGRLQGWSQRVTQEVRRYREALSLLAQDKCSALWWSFALTVIYWAASLAIAPSLLAGLNVKFALVRVTVVQLLLNFIQPFFPTPGASGGAELSFAFFFKDIVPKRLLGIYVLAWRLVSYYISLVLGAFSIVYALKHGWLERNKFALETKEEQQ